MSIVMPAHNEAAVIDRALRRILNDADPGEFEIVVAANGCHDDTATIARAVSTDVRVVELSEASKIAALNAADEAATRFPRAYIDADVEVDASALRVLATALDQPGGPKVAAPELRVNARASSWFVRAYYRVWELTDYRLGGHVGSGIYALSETGRRSFAAFPDVIADDRYVQLLFDPVDRLTTRGQVFTVHAPRTLRALIHRSTRIIAGNEQLAELQARGDLALAPSSDAAVIGWRGLVRRIAPRPALWPSFVVYTYAKVIPKWRARRKVAAGRIRVWERDETSRQ